MTGTVAASMSESQPARTIELGQPIDAPVEDWASPPFPEHSVIEGRHCSLAPLNTSHSDSLFNAFNQDRVGRNWTYLLTARLMSARGLTSG